MRYILFSCCCFWILGFVSFPLLFFSFLRLLPFSYLFVFDDHTDDDGGCDDDDDDDDEEEDDGAMIMIEAK